MFKQLSGLVAKLIILLSSEYLFYLTKILGRLKYNFTILLQI